jgi:hypothetical protein
MRPRFGFVDLVADWKGTTGSFPAPEKPMHRAWGGELVRHPVGRESSECQGHPVPEFVSLDKFAGQGRLRRRSSAMTYKQSGRVQV